MACSNSKHPFKKGCQPATAKPAVANSNHAELILLLPGKLAIASALKHYWHFIAGEFPGFEAIDVIVIDLAIRAQVYDS